MNDPIVDGLAASLYEISGRFIGTGGSRSRLDWSRLAGSGVKQAYLKMAAAIHKRDTVEAQQRAAREAQLESFASLEYVRGCSASPDERSRLIEQLAAEAVVSRREIAAIRAGLLLEKPRAFLPSLLWVWRWRSLGPLQMLALWRVARSAIARARAIPA